MLLQVRQVAEENGVDVSNQIRELEERAKQVGARGCPQHLMWVLVQHTLVPPPGSAHHPRGGCRGSSSSSTGHGAGAHTGCPQGHGCGSAGRSASLRQGGTSASVLGIAANASDSAHALFASRRWGRPMARWQLRSTAAPALWPWLGP